MLVFWFWQVIVVGVTYVLSVQYTCAVVSVFLLWHEMLLWQEILLKMRTPFDFLRAVSTKKILVGYFIMIQLLMCVFCKSQHSFTLYLFILYLSLVLHRSTS